MTRFVTLIFKGPSIQTWGPPKGKEDHVPSSLDGTFMSLFTELFPYSERTSVVSSTLSYPTQDPHISPPGTRLFRTLQSSTSLNRGLIVHSYNRGFVFEFQEIRKVTRYYTMG